MAADMDNQRRHYPRFHRLSRSQFMPPKQSHLQPPTSFEAKGPCEVWSWDITWRPGPVAAGILFYLYLIVDIYSRKIVGWEV